ncbi:hypothetical protein P280DRAFT_226981 [Massarina eburnea CBS 473.64]|uniref:INSIG domain-containing protein n=1 Tax=Massarina eburnea CBS 473.64 TaxID=1395130 RepID=A0A6A6S9D4_9PLEO|nr:hypothetical protein P280DRAFT_226981 [Massarina eburnea CBS 473.64]
MAGEEEPPFVTRATQPVHIYQPKPRRLFTAHPDASDSPSHAFVPTTPPHLAASQSRPSDFLAQLNARLLRTSYAQQDSTSENGALDSPTFAPDRNKSMLNMKSTLFGIYDEDSGTAGEQSIAETPWGTGAETPAWKKGQGQGQGQNTTWEDRNGLGSPDTGLAMKSFPRKGATDDRVTRSPVGRQATSTPRRGLWHYTVVAGKLATLTLFGVVYGVVVSHLHDSRELAAVRVEGVDRESWVYLASWGFAGLSLGSLLPYIELAWGGTEATSTPPPPPSAENDGEDTDKTLSERLNDIVRSVGAFMGIAFAIRRLPWQSTLQLTITLALVNPALWYILDRSKPGLSFSLIVTSVLTSFIFLSNPDVLPSPSLPATTNATSAPSSAHAASFPPGEDLFAGVVSYETLAIVTWVGSVLFCSCVCFGSIGRRLAVWER